MISCFGIILFLYVLLILILCLGFSRISIFLEKKHRPEISFSIIVPYRNEAENLPALLLSLKGLNYPENLFEIILVNDASEDTSKEICTAFKTSAEQLNIFLVNSEKKTNSPKKDAISRGISQSKNRYILTTDADCVVPKNWLHILNDFILERQTKLVAGPVKYIEPDLNRKTSALKSKIKSLFFIFQELDFYSLQGVTIGSFGLKKPVLCSGANFCYEKEAFLAVNGFAGNDHISSGDDIFLLEKFEKAGFKSAFLKSRKAIVSTSPQPNFRDLFSQRVRWAAKASSYKSNFAKGIGILVFLMNAALPFLFILFFFGKSSGNLLLLLFLIKSTADYLLIRATLDFYERQKISLHFLWASIFYPFFSSFIGVYSLFGNFEWKGRSFRK